MEHVGAAIRALRLKRGMSQAALADAVGIRQQTLYRHECGTFKNPRMATLIRIAAALGVPVDKLLAGHNSRTVPHRGRHVKRA